MRVRLPLSRAVLALLIAVGGVRPAAAGAQSQALATARAAQRRFETERARRLPTTAAWSGGSCDEVLGRMCMRHAERDDWYPSPEDSRIGSARDELLHALAAAAPGAAPDSFARGWILGQRVLYLGEAGRWDEAAGLAAAACAEAEGGGAEGGWCRALEGLALHALGHFVPAELAFRLALDAMGPDSAAAWSDPERLLDARGRAWWKDLPPAAREAQAARVWSLADPLFLVPGNDQLTEHWARRTYARARSMAQSPWAMAWGNDLEEVLARYGWEVGWERVESHSLDPTAGHAVVGHHHPEGRPLMPPGSVLADPFGAGREAWRPDFRRPRAIYAAPYAPVLLPGADQIALFPRGDRLIVVGAYALPDDTTWHAAHHHPGRDQPLAPWRDRPAEAGLFLLSLEGGAASARGERSAGTAGVLLLEAPAGRWVASLEVLDPAAKRAGRTRVGVSVPSRPPHQPTLSDLLLVRAPVMDGASLLEAARFALPHTSVGPDEEVAVVWELFGLSPEPLAYRLTIARPRASGLLRAVRALGLFRAPAARRLEWQEPGPDRLGPVLRGVELDLRALEPGPWVVRLEVLSPGHPPLVQERMIEVQP